MIVDRSAILTVLDRETDAERSETAIASAPYCRMSVVNALDTAIVIESRGGAAAAHERDRQPSSAGIEWAPVAVEHMDAARHAGHRFGRGFILPH